MLTFPIVHVKVYQMVMGFWGLGHITKVPFYGFFFSRRDYIWEVQGNLLIRCCYPILHTIQLRLNHIYYSHFLHHSTHCKFTPGWGGGFGCRETFAIFWGSLCTGNYTQMSNCYKPALQIDCQLSQQYTAIFLMLLFSFHSLAINVNKYTLP